MITANEAINIRPKSDDDVMMGQMTDTKSKQQKKPSYGLKNGAAVVDWQLAVAAFESIPREQLLSKISETVLQTTSRVSNNVMAKYLNNESRESYIKSTIVYLMSTPEYQLC